MSVTNVTYSLATATIICYKWYKDNSVIVLLDFYCNPQKRWPRSVPRTRASAYGCIISVEEGGLVFVQKLLFGGSISDSSGGPLAWCYCRGRHRDLSSVPHPPHPSPVHISTVHPCYLALFGSHPCHPIRVARPCTLLDCS